MPTKNVVLTQRQAKLIDKMVSDGEYQNASEALRDGIRLLEERRAEHKVKLKALRDAVQVGIDDLEAGRYTEFASFQEMSAYLRNRTEKVLARRK